MKYPHFNWIKFVIDNRELTFHAKGLALYLYTFMNGHQDMAWPSLARIEADMCLARNTIIKHLKALDDSGFIEVEQRPNRSNIYKASLPGNPIDLLPGGSAGAALASAGAAPGSAGAAPLGVQELHPNNTENIQKNTGAKPPDVRQPVDKLLTSKIGVLKSYLAQLEKFPNKGDSEHAEINRVTEEINQLVIGPGAPGQIEV